MEGVRITKVKLVGDRATARVNGNDVEMLTRMGGWRVCASSRELIGPVCTELNKKVRSLRKGERVEDD